LGVIRLLIKRIVVNQDSPRVTKSGRENVQIQRLGHKNAFSVNIDFYVKPKLSKGLHKEDELCVFDTEMAAQGGIRDKILRVSMPFEKGRNSTRKSKTVLLRTRLLFGGAKDSWAVVFRVHSWAAQVKEGSVRSCAEIARKEGITRARVSQLWPLSEISREQAHETMSASKGRRISIRRLIQIARNPYVK
jgi:hypothetical protein